MAFSQSARAQITDPPTAKRAQTDVTVTVTDMQGRLVRPEKLPAATQARLERVKKAAKSILDTEPGGGGGDQALKVTIRCSWPPLKCDITISFN